MTWSEMTHPDDIAADLEQFNRVLSGKIDYYTMNKRFIRKDGKMAWNKLSVGCVRKSDGSVDHIIAMILDITGVKLAEAELRESEDRYRSLLENANEAIFVAQDRKLVFLNPVTCQSIGYSAGELMGRSFLDFIHPDDRNLVAGNYLKRLKGEDFLPRYTFRYVSRNDVIRWMEINVVRIDWAGRPATLNFGTDVTERKQSEEMILRMAYHDSLTGLPNRKLFSDRLGIALAQARRNQKKVGIAMLDLDNFKTVNDTLGHDVGDQLLIATTERLITALRKSDAIARFGGDEFLLVLPSLNEIEDAIQVAQKIFDSISKPFHIDTHQLTVTTSIGIAFYPQDGTDEGTLLKNADIAMYLAKQAERNQCRLYCEE
jgi:diguanylate cyclase (GGDEF)-like protein/PAS domain S-box-containing protein